MRAQLLSFFNKKIVKSLSLLLQSFFLSNIKGAIYKTKRRLNNKPNKYDCLLVIIYISFLYGKVKQNFHIFLFKCAKIVWQVSSNCVQYEYNVITQCHLKGGMINVQTNQNHRWWLWISKKNLFIDRSYKFSGHQIGVCGMEKF